MDLIFAVLLSEVVQFVSVVNVQLGSANKKQPTTTSYSVGSLKRTSLCSECQRGLRCVRGRYCGGCVERCCREVEVSRSHVDHVGGAYQVVCNWVESCSSDVEETKEIPEELQTAINRLKKRHMRRQQRNQSRRRRNERNVETDLQRSV